MLMREPWLEGAVAHTVSFRADEDMVREGDRPGESKLLLEGFAARYKLLSSGKRQITNIHVLGDSRGPAQLHAQDDGPRHPGAVPLPGRRRAP